MRQILTKQPSLLLGVTILLWAFSSSVAFASHLCGLIITPADSIDIIDCENPFGATTDPTPYTLRIGGDVVNEDSQITIPETGIIDYSVTSQRNDGIQSFYLHDGDDYRLVFTNDPIPTESILRQLAAEYFSPEINSELYIQHLLGNRQGEGDSDWSFPLLLEFSDYVYTNYTPIKPPLLPGTYTLVSEEPLIILSDRQLNNSLWEQVIEFFIPVAHAQFLPNPIYTLTFTLLPEVIEPTGASSVLFLPGIMGSRLYEIGDFCGESNSEQELWFTLDECLQLRMTTKFTGSSVNPVFTKPGMEGILDEALIFNIYKTFLNELQDWKDDEIINDYSVIPYDWRVELNKIITSRFDENTGQINTDVSGTVVEGYLYKQLVELASSSKNGKVTIVAHSNGGLVAKQFLSALENINDPLLGKIDNLILVAVPQLGTPESMVGILHGLELGPTGVVMSQSTARQLSNKMAFSHHLLPTLGYFDSVDTPVIIFEAGSSTSLWASTFGNTITSRDGMHEFLDNDSGRAKPAVADLSTPEVVDGLLLDYAKTVDILQSNWESPETMKVYQIAGTGLETPSGITYFTDRECVSRILFVCTGYSEKLGYRVNMVLDGDESVVAPSALALSDSNENDEKWWLNIFDYNEVNFDRKHKDVFEVEDVITFVSNTIQSATTSYTYLSNAAPTLGSTNRLVFQLHSPLDMSLVTSDGRELSSSTNEIDRATYRRYGELQYISVPSTEDNATLRLNGLATGSFTLDVEEVDNGIVTDRHTYSAIPSSTSTKAAFIINEDLNLEEATIEIDYQGDGVVDLAYNTEGVIEDAVTYDDLFLSIKSLGFKKLFEQTLINTAKAAETFYNKSLVQTKYKKLEEASLQILKKQVLLYEKIRLITRVQRQSVESIINSLLNR